MIKISKNIKRFRKENNLTQEQLAERMNVTRQAISNWENDKSQPDINSITQLADIFNISIEEMVYGSLKKVGFEENRENKINVIKIVLSVIGGLFLSAGLIVLFVAFWKDFPDFFKTILSIVPFLLGFALAAFVCLKKKDSAVMREIAGIVWCVGVISSSLLITEAIEFDNYSITLILVCLLIAAAMFIMKSVSALPIYYIFQGIFSFYNVDWGRMESGYFDFTFLLILPLFAVGAAFTYLKSKEPSETGYKFCLWVSAAAFIITCYSVFMYEDILVAVLLLALFLSYCMISEKENIYNLPFKVFGTLGICITSLVPAELVCDVSEDIKTEIGVPLIFSIILAIAVLVISIVFVHNDFEFNVSNIVLCASVGISALLIIIFSFNYDSFDYETIRIILLLSASVVGISQILKGVNNLSLFELNVGIITIFIVAGFLTSVWFELNLFSVGGLLIAFGLAMFFANWLVSKKKNAKIQSNS